jgi:hypothetical protein
VVSAANALIAGFSCGLQFGATPQLTRLFVTNSERTIGHWYQTSLLNFSTMGRTLPGLQYMISRIINICFLAVASSAL